MTLARPPHSLTHGLRSRAILAVAAVLLFSSSATHVLSPLDSSVLFHRIEFAMVSSTPGAALAFRLANGQKKPKNPIRICYRRECFQVIKRWQIFATDPQIAGKQVLAIIDGRGGWTFRKIHLEGDLWQQVHQKIVPLRLPASVLQEIDDHANLIPLESASDAHLYASTLERPWSSRWVMPVRSRITSEFGSLRIPPHGQPYAHTGVDLRAMPGTAVHSTSDGIVVGTDDEIIYGNVITIDHGYGLITRYMHLSSFNVNVGDRVKAGDVIGLSGSTGRAEAPHLHWEMRVRGQPVDPLSTRRLLVRLSDLE